MDELTKIAVLTVPILALAVLLKRDVPPLALMVSVLAVVAVLMVVLTQLSQVNGLITRAAELADMGGELITPLLKTVGIALVVKVLASLCRDAQETALASAVEIAGAVAAVVVLLPLLHAVLNLCVSLVE